MPHPGRASAGVPPWRSDVVGDISDDRTDLTSEEDQGNDRHDRDQREDERIFGEALTGFIAGDARPKVPDPNHRLSPWHARRRASAGSSGPGARSIRPVRWCPESGT